MYWADMTAVGSHFALHNISIVVTFVPATGVIATLYLLLV